MGSLEDRHFAYWQKGGCRSAVSVSEGNFPFVLEGSGIVVGLSRDCDSHSREILRRALLWLWSAPSASFSPVLLPEDSCF